MILGRKLRKQREINVYRELSDIKRSCTKEAHAKDKHKDWHVSKEQGQEG